MKEAVVKHLEEHSHSLEPADPSLYVKEPDPDPLVESTVKCLSLNFVFTFLCRSFLYHACHVLFLSLFLFVCEYIYILHSAGVRSPHVAARTQAQRQGHRRDRSRPIRRPQRSGCSSRQLGQRQGERWPGCSHRLRRGASRAAYALVPRTRITLVSLQASASCYGAR